MSLRSLCLVAVWPLAVGACVSERSAGDGIRREDATAEGEACSEAYATSWFVSLDGGSCADVPGDHGVWTARSVDAEPTDAVCALSWQGDAGVRADVPALRSFASERAEVIVPACSGTDVAPASLTPIPFVDDLNGAGAHGCDVCGKLRMNRRLTVILPGEALQRRFEAPLSDGSKQAFQIETQVSTGVLNLELPVPPAGLAYVPGRVEIR